jgi:trehalose 6-phosphate phosphatase
VRDRVRSIVAAVPGSRLEDKGLSLAVHYRGAPRPDVAAIELANALVPLAERNRLALLPGKMVMELTPAGTPGKGWVVASACRDRHLRGCLYAGDDLADLDAFAALDALRADGMVTVKVAVASDETPSALTDVADLVVDRPAGLVAFLRGALG